MEAHNFNAGIASNFFSGGPIIFIRRTSVAVSVSILDLTNVLVILSCEKLCSHFEVDTGKLNKISTINNAFEQLVASSSESKIRFHVFWYAALFGDIYFMAYSRIVCHSSSTSMGLAQ